MEKETSCSVLHQITVLIYIDLMGTTLRSAHAVNGVFVGHWLHEPIRCSKQEGIRIFAQNRKKMMLHIFSDHRKTSKWTKNTHHVSWITVHITLSLFQYIALAIFHATLVKRAAKILPTKTITVIFIDYRGNWVMGHFNSDIELSGRNRTWMCAVARWMLRCLARKRW